MSYAEKLLPPQPAPPTIAPPLSWSRIIGLCVLGLWTALAISLLYMMVTGWDSEKFLRYGPRYLSGLWVTISLVGLSVILGGLLSLPIAFARMSGSRILNAIAYCYVYIFRGTPLLAQLYLIY